MDLRASTTLLAPTLLLLLCGAAQKNLSEEALGPANLILSLIPNKDIYVLYEPVVLTYTVTNPMNSIISSSVKMSYHNNKLKLSVQYEGDDPNRFFSGAIAHDITLRDTIHLPGQIMSEEVSMFFNTMTRGAPSLAFPKLGRYTIRARMLVARDPEPVFIEAEPIKVKLVKPRPADWQAIEYLGSKENLFRLLRGGVGSYCNNQPAAECFEHLRLFLRSFPDSAYAPNITFDLASAVEQASIDVKPRYELAVQLFSDFLEQWPHHPFAADVTAGLVFALDGAGREKEAIEWIDRFERKFPNKRPTLWTLRYEIQGIQLEGGP